MRLLNITLAALLLSFLLLVIVALTPTGLHGAVWLAKLLLPGELIVTEPSGRLVDQIEFKKLHYRENELEILLKDFNLSWQPMSLARGLVEVDLLTAAAIDVTIPAAADETAKGMTLTPALAVQLKKLNIESLHIRQAGTAAMTYGNIRATAHSEQSQLFIENLTLTGDVGDKRFRITASGQIQLVAPWRHKLQTTFELSLPGQPLINGHVSSQGDAESLIFNGTTNTPLGMELHGSASHLLDNTPEWQARLTTRRADLSPWLDTDMPPILTADIRAVGYGHHVQADADLELTGVTEVMISASSHLQLEKNSQLNIASLTLHSPTHGLAVNMAGILDYADAAAFDMQGGWTLEEAGSVQGEGTLALAGTMADYKLQLTAKTQQPLASSWQLSATGDSQSLAIANIDGELSKGRVNATGQLDWRQAPALTLRGEWQNISLPLPGQTLVSPTGHLDVHGNTASYTVTTDGVLTSPSLPRMQWSANATGDPTQLVIDTLRLSLPAGQITASGQAGWADVPELTADIRLHAIDPGSHWPDWPGRLNGQAQLKLRRQGQRWHASINRLQLAGHLRGYPVTAAGGMAIAEEGYIIRQLRLAVADSQLSADGRLSADSELNWQFHSPDLEQLLPETSGHAKAAGRLRGDFEHPDLWVTVSAGELNSPWLNLEQLNGELDLRSRQDSFTAEINAAGLQLEQQRIDRASIHASGRLSQHDLAAAFESGERSLELAGNGRWQGGLWSLNFGQGVYHSPATGDWQLESPLQASISENRLESPEHCWQRQPSRLCLRLGWQRAGAWHGRLSLEHYTLAEPAKTLTEAAPPLRGELALTLELSGQDQMLQHARGRLRINDLILNPDDETELRISRVDADLSGNPDGITLTMNGDFAEPSPGNLAGRIRTGRLDLTRLPATSLSGDIRADIDDLRPWLALYPRFTAEQARLDMNFVLSGQLGSPVLDGSMRLLAKDAAVPDLGIGMQTFELQITGQPQNGLQLSGHATSGPGQLTMNGTVSVVDGLLTLPEMHITGERFELINLPEAWVLISPDLHLQYRNKLLIIDGDVSVPEALIQPFGAPGTIPVSDDEHIVTETEGRAPVAVKTRAEIALQLGDKVRVTGRGFEGRLEGSLDIRQQPDKLASADGELQVVDASYSAYGQELEVRSGEIIFTNHPIDNPAIQAEAVRSIGDVTVGVRASGTAQQPVIELFSIPAMAEADILSYLVIGRPLAGASSNEGQILLQAAATMGLKGTTGIRQTIASTLGLDTLAVDTGTTAEGESETRLVIGKYLSPDLYISYGAGLVDSAVDTVRLRYEINRHLSLEAEQGVGTGVDLLYQIESGGWWN